MGRPSNLSSPHPLTWKLGIQWLLQITKMWKGTILLEDDCTSLKLRKRVNFVVLSCHNARYCLLLLWTRNWNCHLVLMRPHHTFTFGILLSWIVFVQWTRTLIFISYAHIQSHVECTFVRKYKFSRIFSSSIFILTTIGNSKSASLTCCTIWSLVSQFFWSTL